MLTFRRKLPAFFFGALLLLVLIQPVAAQDAYESDLMQPQVGVYDYLGMEMADPSYSSPVGSGRSAGLVSLASVGGWVVGGAGLALIGFGVDAMATPMGGGLYIPQGPIIGAAIGTTIGPSLAAHFANHREGRLLPGLLANVAISGLIIFAALGRPSGSEALLYVLPAAQIGAGAGMELWSASW